VLLSDGTNHHPGNGFFLALIDERKDEYKAASTQGRKRIMEAIVEEVTNRSPSGRFLERSAYARGWRKVRFRKALEKTRQALTDRLRPTKESQSRLARRSHRVSRFNCVANRKVGEPNYALTIHHSCPILRKT
jgi:hypothetical protein